MTTHIETLDTPIINATTNAKLSELEPAYEYDEARAGDRVITLDQGDEKVVITGDLENFARVVWLATFGHPPVPDDQP